MRNRLRLVDIARTPSTATAVVRLPSGQSAELRPLASTDALALGEYFLGLSAATTRLYSPHPFDQVTANCLCRQVNNADVLRLIAAVGSGREQRIIAYFILHWGIHEGELERYRDAGVQLDPEHGCTVAPSVADRYQNQGLGSAMMCHLLRLARAVGRKYMVLQGGTREENVRAVHFYRKYGFKKVGEFAAEGVNNYDMMAVLEADEADR